MIPQTDRDAIEHYHDHDMTAEDRPTPDDEYHDITLSSRVLRDTLIKMVGTYRGDSNEASEFVYTTWVKKWTVDRKGGTRWEAEQTHDSLFDAVSDAANHAPKDDAWTEPDILRMVSQMIGEASHNARS